MFHRSLRIVGSRVLASVVTLITFALPCAAQETRCDKGDTEVRRLEFDGNTAFTDAELENGIVTTASSALYKMFRVFGSKRCLDKLQLPYDALRLATFYKDHGFQRVKVQLDTSRVSDNAIDVNFRIEEGPPVIIQTVIITGLERMRDSAQLAAGFSARPGDRFDESLLDRDVERVVSGLHNNGYPRGDVFLNSSVDSSALRATVNLDIRPGRLTRISRILIRIEQDSARRGKPPAISETTVRRLLGFREGDLASASSLLDAQRNLFQTYAYRNVRISPAADSLQPQADSLMVIQAVLVEGDMHDLRVGGGWGTLDCFRAQVTYIDRSFLGDARQLELSGRVSKIGLGYPLDGAESFCRQVARDDIYSDTLNYRLGFTLRQPGIFGLGPRNAPTLTVYTEQRSEYLAYFRSVPLGFATSITRNLRPNSIAALPLSISYALEYGSTQAQPAVYCALFNLCGEEERDRISRRQRLAVGSISLLRDSRDYPLDPSRGSSLQFEWRHASKPIFSDPSLQFNTIVADYRRYWSAGGGVVLSARVRGGLVLGQQLNLQVRQEDGSFDEVRVSGYVPPAERLYAGGPSSVRGYRFNELGPEVYIASSYDTVAAIGDTVFFRTRNEVQPERSVPAGGNTMVIANFEARIPSPFLRNIITYALFVDAGEVWNRGESVGTAEAKYAGIKITPGAGLRISSPVGPIRVDVGYNPYNRRPGVAYFDAPVGEGGEAPLYCVSPGNTLKVVPAAVSGKPAVQIDGSGVCGSTFLPEGRRGLRRLTFNFSIGQAF